jgi:hypothetical protein
LFVVSQGIDTTGCVYCWIDNLAIPSERKLRSVQKTLLSRMMAVYSAALVTMALRSRETEGDRYHQRVWTLQEFCAARSLIVVTETCVTGQDEEAPPGERHAVFTVVYAKENEAKYGRSDQNKDHSCTAAEFNVTSAILPAEAQKNLVNSGSLIGNFSSMSICCCGTRRHRCTYSSKFV